MLRGQPAGPTFGAQAIVSPAESAKVYEVTPLELKTEQEWQEILDRFAREIGMTACLTDDKGGLLQCRGDRPPLCKAIRDKPQALTFICSQTNSAMLAEAKVTLRPQIDLCEAGLLRVVVPLIHDGVLVGQIAACGLAPLDQELDSFLIGKQLGLSEEQVLELARATPRASEEALRSPVDRLFWQLHP
jgi:ligand-binding sensor protein